MSYKLNLIHNRESVRWTNDIYGHTCMCIYDIIFVCVFGIRLDKVKHIFPLFETKVSGMICIFRRLWERRKKKHRRNTYLYIWRILYGFFVQSTRSPTSSLEPFYKLWLAFLLFIKKHMNIIHINNNNSLIKQ